jgi:signal peptidase II
MRQKSIVKFWLIGFGALFLALDQIIKYFVLIYAASGTIPFSVLPILNIVCVFNKGVSFGMLSSLPPLYHNLLIALTVIVIMALGVWFFYTSSRLLQWALICILAGALGNLIDRCLYGHVVDFIDFHIRSWHFPAFNFADTLITIGTGLLFLETFLGNSKR